jgi:hypothetical protein
MAKPSITERQYGPALEKHYQFVLWLIPALEKLPRSQKYLLGDRMQAQALDVLSQLIAATYSKDRRSALAQANLGLEQLRFLIRLAKDLQHIDLRRYEFAARAVDETGRLIGGWQRSANNDGKTAASEAAHEPSPSAV